MVKRLSEPHPGAPATKVAQVLPVSTLRKLQVLAWRLDRDARK